MLKKLFGDKSFYKLVLKITLPIMAQQVLINVVGLVDNLMVGTLNQDIISGVYIATQILFVMNLTLFGGLEGASIFFAQFFGSKDDKRLKQCFNFKLYSEAILGFISFFVIFFLGESIAKLFVDNNRAFIAGRYLKIYSTCLIPFILTNVYGTCFRESNKSIVPMIGSIIAIIVNIGLNYLLIFEHNGHFGFKEQGAALATVIARFIECLFILIYAYIKKPSFTHSLFKDYQIEKKLLKQIFIRSIPLVINEFLWSMGQIMLVFAYSKVSDDAAACLSISQTLFNVFYIATIALGNGIAVIMGNTLGENKLHYAKQQIIYFLTLAVILAIFMGGLLAIIGPYVAKLYEVNESVRQTAIHIIYFNAILMIIFSLNCTIFYCIRSGGFTAVVLIFDSLFSWLVQVPLALLLAYKSSLSLPLQFFIVNIAELIKLLVGVLLIKSGIWVKNLTNFDQKKVDTAH